MIARIGLGQMVPPGPPPTGFPGGGPPTPPGSEAMPWFYTVAIVAGIAALVVYWLYRRGRRLEWAWRRAVRSRRVELLAEEAVLDDPAFAPEVVKAAAVELHTGIVAAWTAADHCALQALVGRELLAEWHIRLQELQRKGWTNPVRRRGRPRVRYVGLVNRPGDEEDRVVVHIRARMRDRVYDADGHVVFRDGDDNGRHTTSEYWTLAKRDGHWVLASVETDWEGAHHLTDPLIPSPWADDRLADAATIERAAATTIPPATLAGAVPAELAPDLRIAALDLAGFDGRYAPDVLEAAAQQTVAAWAEAIDGNRQPLAALVGQSGVETLLHPDRNRRHRLVIRAPRLRRLRIVALQPKASPPTMTVEAMITGRQYLEHRANGAVLVGSRDHDSAFSVRWDLVLSKDPDVPWHIAHLHLDDPPPIGLWWWLTRALPMAIYDFVSYVVDTAR